MMQHNAAAVLAIGAAVVFASPAEARRSTDISKLKAELASIKRDLANVRDKVGTLPLSLFVASVVALPPDGTKAVVPVVKVPPARGEDIPRTLSGYGKSLPGVSLAGVPQPLVEWLHKVRDACPGFKAISACRPGARVRGSGRTSLHASCRAVDFQLSEPACAQRVMAKFPGGMSNDYRRVNHFHVSWAKGSGEWGARFAHYGGKRYAKRYKARYRYARYYRRSHG
jgi:hypothetical protein